MIVNLVYFLVSYREYSFVTLGGYLLIGIIFGSFVFLKQSSMRGQNEVEYVFVVSFRSFSYL